MKPAFALDFRDETISLLHRTKSGWQAVGAVPLDTPDLSEALGYLRTTALGLSPRGMATKLIIPNEQILYTTVTAPGTTAKKRHAQVVAALAGRTPYDVADLAFDYSGDGPELLVAVIAKETLAEAEAFAVEHRLNPVSFVAIPDAGQFTGEPWFGVAAHAASLLSGDETVERDADAVWLPARAVAAEAAAEPAVSQDPPPRVEPDVEPQPEFEPQPEPEIVPLADPEPEAEPVSIPDLEPEFLPDEEPAPSEQREAFTASVVFTDTRAGDRGETSAVSDRFDDFSDALVPAVAQPTPAVMTDADEAPMALDVAYDDMAEEPQGLGAIKSALAAQSARVIETRIDDDLPPMPSEAARVAFSSRRSGDEANGAAPSLGSAMAPAKGEIARPAAARPLNAPMGERTAGPIVPRPTGARPEPVAKPAKSAKSALRGLGALVTAPGIAGSKPRSKVSIPSALPPLRPTDPGAAAATTAAAARPASARAPGGFKARPVVKGKPRFLGLILTAVLLFLLAMIAAWSSYSLGAWNTTDAAGDAVVEDAAPQTDGDLPDPTDEMLADMQDPAELAASAAVADDALTPPSEADVAEAAPAPVTDLVADAAEPDNPTADAQDEIFLAAMDAPPSAPDPLSLPAPAARGDPLPAAQPAPPPFGTVYQFEPDGTIRPTPEGIITPEGVLLRAGKPARVPAVRPQSVTVAALALRPAGAVAPVDPAAPAAFPSDPALADKRPKTRPAGLAPVAAPSDQGSLAPAADSRFASLRPQPRPQNILSAGNQARLASANASLAAQAEVAVQEAALSGGSKMAIAISRKPAPRPRDMSRAVEAAVAAASRTPEPQPEPEAEVAAKPDKDTVEADNEPEVASAAPKIPTKATVAKQATFKNAINLSKINLIGVYGTQSKRYALVRTAAGRYKKVRVGDTLDGGGKVAAITANEVRYQKSGKMVTLAMPKG